jgi:hypothetical protein
MNEDSMSTLNSQPLPSTRQLLKATALAAAAASVLLVTFVLPAEYGIDPTGIGAKIGLDVLSATVESPVSSVPTKEPESASTKPDNASEEQKAIAAFGVSKGQTFETSAVARGSSPPRRDTLVLNLEPGKGSEVKSLLKTGDSFVFHWIANGEVAVDMHGENPQSAQGGFTSYWVEPGQREASGTFIAPFDGTHGWYWLNRGTTPVTIEIEVIGFQQNLYFPNQQ